MPSPISISVSNLTKRFGPIIAVDQLTFDVRHGEIFGLVGPDGAGKTTTLRMLAGVLGADGGSVTMEGGDVLRDPERAKNALSYMPQRFGLYEDLTVDENIEFYADLFGVKRAIREQQSVKLLAAAGMGEFRKRLAGKLSGGMKQKLGLACALIHTPKVILLDEPTTGVDPVSRRDFWKILYELALEGVTIVTSTAYLDEAERCHRVALLDRGKLLLCDEPGQLKRRLGKDVIAVSSAEPRGVRDVLSDAQGISALVLTGDGVHAVVDEAQRRIAEFKSRLASAGVPFDDLVITSPSIEDLFVDTVTRKGEA
ncbi:MAG TPA: ABC transporter ATP-binding protein [Verrucomicrobiae bacterium]|jgi:ABC-2 type transport system ATP-binding protein|nr:ABC transporter ATP-binding protein [Verrucomicrobiae bacterium]